MTNTAGAMWWSLNHVGSYCIRFVRDRCQHGSSKGTIAENSHVWWENPSRSKALGSHMLSSSLTWVQLPRLALSRLGSRLGPGMSTPLNWQRNQFHGLGNAWNIAISGLGNGWGRVYHMKATWFNGVQKFDTSVYDRPGCKMQISLLF